MPLKFRKNLSLVELKKGILSGNRFTLSKAITLAESSLKPDQEKASALLNELMPYTGRSIRVGITGVPGVGKSTFIECFGSLLARENKVAILAVDPSSNKTKGSIMGDKTRMTTLSNHENAYIRPSPTGNSLGGVAQKTRESMLLCEAAGFNIILIETVGVGQSEVAVKEMVDCFLLLSLAGAGDELQGIKKGIMEMADIISITKADGDNERQAKKAKADIENALKLFRWEKENWQPKVLTCSALLNLNIDTIWNEVQHYYQNILQTGWLDQNRKNQQLNWMHESIKEQLTSNFYQSAKMKTLLAETESNVLTGQANPFHSAKQLLDSYLESIKKPAP